MADKASQLLPGSQETGKVGNPDVSGAWLPNWILMGDGDYWANSAKLDSWFCLLSPMLHQARIRLVNLIR